MIGWFIGLKAAGATPIAVVLGEGRTEEHRDFQVFKIPVHDDYESSTQDFADWAINVKPDTRALHSILEQIAPDMVVVRGLTSRYIRAALPRLWRRAKLTLYTQGPIESVRSTRRWLKNTLLLALCGGRWFSPVIARGDILTNAWRDTRIRYIPFAVETHEAAFHRTWSFRAPRLLSVGKMEPRKNHELALRALATAPSHFSLTVVGECSTPAHEREQSRLRALVHTLELEPRVTILTNVRHEEMRTLFSHHDLFLQISVNEPASVSQLEAMAHGLGVVIARENGTACYVGDNLNGAHIDANLESLSGILHTIAATPSVLQTWGRTSHARAQAAHSPAATAQQMLELFSR